MQLQAARTANEVFRLTGERRQIFDEYNILSAESLGALVAFVGAHPELELPADWPASFFLHASVDPGPQTAAEIDAALTALAEQQKALEAKRAELVLAEAAAAQAATDAAQADAEYQAKKKAAALSRKEERDAKARLASAKKVARKTKKQAK